MLKLLDFRTDKKALQTTGKAVSMDTIDTSDFTENIAQMCEILKLDGVGLAATQVGWNVRLFMLCIDADDNKLEKPQIYLNPKIHSYSKSQVSMLEGCLSFPGLFTKITRPKSIDWEYQNLEGEIIKLTSSDFLARAVQHEIDHCDGKVFITKASTVQKLKINRWLLS